MVLCGGVLRLCVYVFCWRVRRGDLIRRRKRGSAGGRGEQKVVGVEKKRSAEAEDGALSWVCLDPTQLCRRDHPPQKCVCVCVGASQEARSRRGARK